MTEAEALDLVRSLAWKEGCWLWAGRVDPTGSPVAYIDGAPELVHRFVYRVFRERGHELQGPLDPHQPLLRSCGNPRCVSPWHLYPAGVGASPRGEANRSKRKCPRGHVYSGINLHVRPCGRRRCRTCHQQHVRRWREKQGV